MFGFNRKPPKQNQNQAPQFSTGVARVPAQPGTGESGLVETRRYAEDPRRAAVAPHGGEAALARTVALGATPAAAASERSGMQRFNVDKLAGSSDTHTLRSSERYFDPRKDQPRVPREVMKRELGVDAALAATVVLNPRGTQPPVRVHVLDRGSLHPSATEPARGHRLTEGGQPVPDSGVYGGRYVLATDGFMQTMRSIREGQSHMPQPSEGHGWALLPEQRGGVGLGGDNWQTRFGESLPADIAAATRGEHVFFDPAGDSFRVTDMSGRGTDVVTAQAPQQVAGQSFWAQPNPQ